MTGGGGGGGGHHTFFSDISHPKAIYGAIRRRAMCAPASTYMMTHESQEKRGTRTPQPRACVGRAAETDHHAAGLPLELEALGHAAVVTGTRALGPVADGQAHLPRDVQSSQAPASTLATE